MQTDANAEIHETLKRIESLLRLQYWHTYSRSNGKVLRGGLPCYDVISKILKQDEAVAFSLRKQRSEDSF